MNRVGSKRSFVLGACMGIRAYRPLFFCFRFRTNKFNKWPISSYDDDTSFLVPFFLSSTSDSSRLDSLGDRGQLNKQLAYASDFPSEIGDTAEQERMELLTEIAKQWQMTPGRIPGEHESLYTTLLQHLAQ